MPTANSSLQKQREAALGIEWDGSRQVSIRPPLDERIADYVAVTAGLPKLGFSDSSSFHVSESRELRTDDEVLGAVACSLARQGYLLKVVGRSVELDGSFRSVFEQMPK